MEYILYIFCIAIFVYALTTIKKKEVKNEYNFYENFRYYKLWAFAIIAGIAIIIAVFGLIIK